MPILEKRKRSNCSHRQKKISFYEARKRLSYLFRKSYTDVTQSGAASQRPQTSSGSTQSGPLVTPSAPVMEAASAAPSTSKGPQTPVSLGPKITRMPRPEIHVSAPNSRSSSASDRAMEIAENLSVIDTEGHALPGALQLDKVPITTQSKR